MLMLAGFPGATPAMCPFVNFHERPDHVTVWALALCQVQSRTQLNIIQIPSVFDIAASRVLAVVAHHLWISATNCEQPQLRVHQPGLGRQSVSTASHFPLLPNAGRSAALGCLERGTRFGDGSLKNDSRLPRLVRTLECRGGAALQSRIELGSQTAPFRAGRSAVDEYGYNSGRSTRPTRTGFMRMYSA